MAGEEDAAVDIGGRNYIIEFAIMQQVNTRDPACISRHGNNEPHPQGLYD
jgi:hypothetical protein